MGGRAQLRGRGEAGSSQQRSYVELRPQVAKIVSSLLGGSPPADLIHDICVDVTLAQGRFRGQSAFSTWLFAIVRHHVHNWIRKERKLRGLMRGAAEASRLDPAPRPDEVANSRVLFGELKTWSGTLTEGQRRCLFMVGCECMSSRDVGLRLCMTPNAVRMNVRRARVRLHRWLADGG